MSAYPQIDTTIDETPYIQRKRLVTVEGIELRRLYALLEAVNEHQGEIEGMDWLQKPFDKCMDLFGDRDRGKG